MSRQTSSHFNIVWLMFSRSVLVWSSKIDQDWFPECVQWSASFHHIHKNCWSLKTCRTYCPLSYNLLFSIYWECTTCIWQVMFSLWFFYEVTHCITWWRFCSHLFSKFKYVFHLIILPQLVINTYIDEIVYCQFYKVQNSQQETFINLTCFAFIKRHQRMRYPSWVWG